MSVKRYLFSTALKKVATFLCFIYISDEFEQRHHCYYLCASRFLYIFFLPLSSPPLHSMKNHEKSKKHREMVALLRQQLEEEDDALGLHLEGSENENEGEEEEEEKPRQKYIFNFVFVFFYVFFSFSKLDFYCSATLIGKHNIIRNQKSIRKYKNQAVWRKCKGEVIQI